MTPNDAKEEHPPPLDAPKKLFNGPPHSKTVLANDLATPAPYPLGDFRDSPKESQKGSRELVQRRGRLWGIVNPNTKGGAGWGGSISQS